MLNLKERIEEIIEKKKLKLSFDEVMPYIQPTIGMLKEVVESEDDIEIGKSKIGGCPDLPKGWTFPVYELNNKSLAFLCQINCSEVSRYDTNKELPDTGILYYFMETAELPSYCELGEDVFGSWKVLYYDSEMEGLERVQYPFYEDEEYRPFPAFKLRFKNTFTMLEPYENRDVYEELLYENIDDLTTLQAIIYKELHHDLKDLLESENAESLDFKPYHQLLGYHQNVQADSLLDLICDFFKVPEGDAHATKKEKANWKLLFQFDYDEELNWHLDGKIYFFIPKNALAQRNFDGTYVTWSC